MGGWQRTGGARGKWGLCSQHRFWEGARAPGLSLGSRRPQGRQPRAAPHPAPQPRPRISTVPPARAPGSLRPGVGTSSVPLAGPGTLRSQPWGPRAPRGLLAGQAGCSSALLSDSPSPSMVPELSHHRGPDPSGQESTLQRPEHTPEQVCWKRPPHSRSGPTGASVSPAIKWALAPAEDDLSPSPSTPGDRSPQPSRDPAPFLNPPAGPRLGFPSWWPNPWIVRGWFYIHLEAFHNRFTGPQNRPCRLAISGSLIENSLPAPLPLWARLRRREGLGTTPQPRGPRGALPTSLSGVPLASDMVGAAGTSRGRSAADPGPRGPRVRTQPGVCHACTQRAHGVPGWDGAM